MKNSGAPIGFHLRKYAKPKVSIAFMIAAAALLASGDRSLSQDGEELFINNETGDQTLSYENYDFPKHFDGTAYTNEGYQKNRM